MVICTMLGFCWFDPNLIKSVAVLRFMEQVRGLFERLVYLLVEPSA